MVRCGWRSPGRRSIRAVAGGCVAVLATLVALAALPPGAHGQELDPAVGRAVDARDYASLGERGAGVMDELAALYRARRDDPAGRERVAHAFYQLGIESAAAAEVLLADVQAEDTPDDLRVSAQYALGRVSDAPVVVEALLANMRAGKTFYVRDKAACALAYDQIHLDPRQKVALFRGLIAALEDPAFDVRKIAALALKIHTGQLKGYLPAAPPEQRAAAVERWREWLATYEANL